MELAWEQTPDHHGTCETQTPSVDLFCSTQPYARTSSATRVGSAIIHEMEQSEYRQNGGDRALSGTGQTGPEQYDA